MHERINKFSIAGDTFKPEMHFLKTKKEYKNLKKREIQVIYQNELDKACFPHDMAYGDFKDLNRRTVADKVLCDKAFNIAKNPKYDW